MDVASSLELEGPLPSGITELKFYPLRPLSLTESQNLPTAGLVSLVACLATPYHPSGPWKIADTLRSLSSKLFLFENLEHLPRSLTLLSIEYLDSHPSHDSSKTWKNALPPSLTNLMIAKAAADVPAIELETLLPLKSLRLLDIRLRPLPSKIVRYLPRYLRHLAIALEGLNEDDAPFLPRSLETINIHCDAPNWCTPAVKKHWPSKLHDSLPGLYNTNK